MFLNENIETPSQVEHDQRLHPSSTHIPPPPLHTHIHKSTLQLLQSVCFVCVCVWGTRIEVALMNR